jgi:hypothetical protein
MTHVEEVDHQPRRGGRHRRRRPRAWTPASPDEQEDPQAGQPDDCQRQPQPGALRRRRLRPDSTPSRQDRPVRETRPTRRPISLSAHLPHPRTLTPAPGPRQLSSMRARPPHTLATYVPIGHLGGRVRTSATGLRRAPKRWSRVTLLGRAG